MKPSAGALFSLFAVGVLASCASPPQPSHVVPAAHPAERGHPAAPAVSAAGTARLYPVNNGALAGGVRTARLTDEGNGRGTIEFTMPYGERINGEYAPVADGTAGFGSIYKAVFNPNGKATSAAPKGSPSSVTAAGVDGTRVECEYYSDSGHWSGGCRTSTGFLYRLQN